MFRYLLLPSSLLIALFISQLSFAEIYRWVDEKGQLQFSDRPLTEDLKPHEVEANNNVYGGSQILNRQRELLDRYEEQDQQQQKDQQQAKQEAVVQEKRHRACLRAKDKLARYERGSMYTLDSEGDRVYYSEEKRAQVIRDYRNMIDKNCS